MSNTNDGFFRPEPGSSFFPGKPIDASSRTALNHNFLATRSGHTLVMQAGGGELIKTDGTWREFGMYVIRLHPRGGALTLQLKSTTGTAGYEFRFTAGGSAGILTSGSANAGNSFTIAYTGIPAGYYDEYLAVNLQVRRTSGTGDVTIGELRLWQADITADPYTTESRIPGLDTSQWATAGAALDVRAVRHATNTTADLYDASRKHIVNISTWSTFSLESPNIASLTGGCLGKSGVATTTRAIAGLHMGRTGRRIYRVFATGRVSGGTATLTMSAQGYADASFAFTIANTGAAPMGYGNWSTWDNVWTWSPRVDLAEWNLVASVPASQCLYLQALTIIEEPDAL